MDAYNLRVQLSHTVFRSQLVVLAGGIVGAFVFGLKYIAGVGDREDRILLGFVALFVIGGVVLIFWPMIEARRLGLALRGLRRRDPAEFVLVLLLVVTLATVVLFPVTPDLVRVPLLLLFVALHPLDLIVSLAHRLDLAEARKRV